jgi:hypothetical protein
MLTAVVMNDEANFHLNGFVNKQNCRFWAVENPRELHQRPLHSSKVTVWCGDSRVGIVGLYFFLRGATAVSVISARYVDVLNYFLRPELQKRGVKTREMWFQQDGARAHTARVSMEVVRRMYPQHVTSRFVEVSWPHVPLIYRFATFLWDYLKCRMNASRPRTIEELKRSIRQEIAALIRREGIGL